MGITNGYPTVMINANSKEWFTLRRSQKSSLMSQNTRNCLANDIAWKNLDTGISLIDKFI